MGGYYNDRLSAERLKKVYEIAPPRVAQYLRSEIDFVISKIKPSDKVLELGCGYGRVLLPLARGAAFAVGVDKSSSSLKMATSFLYGHANVSLLCMDAINLGFADGSFDVVVCIQNGISAFHVDQRELIEESLRVTRPGGMALFSSYSEKLWDDRLQWFQLQADAGLLGQIDYGKTADGVIVCRDGFVASTVDENQFVELTSGLDAEVRIVEIDNSSIFCGLKRR